jgi:hypothetical protein
MCLNIPYSVEVFFQGATNKNNIQLNSKRIMSHPPIIQASEVSEIYPAANRESSNKTTESKPKLNQFNEW